MKYIIEYALCCNRGKLRRKNQDNFMCDGFYLDKENNGIEGIKKGKTTSNAFSVFALFDGMGGEQLGEYAAYIGAKTLAEKSDEERTNEVSFSDICREINHNICTFAKENGVSSMGTTGCFIGFNKKNISICNIGDSRIYLFSKGEITQLSVDHSLKIASGKAPLTQFLGVPEDEFLIQPYCSSEQYRKDDRYLVCSDGLTDMVSSDEIVSVLSSEKSCEECCQELCNKALEAGGRDNITILICDIKKKKIF